MSFLQMWKQCTYSKQISLKENCLSHECCCNCSHTVTAHWDQHRILNIKDSGKTWFCHTTNPYSRKKTKYFMTSWHMTLSYVHLPAAWWAFMLEWYQASDDGFIQSYVTFSQTTYDVHSIYTVKWSRYICLRSILCGMRYQPSSFYISLQISPTLYILSSSLTVSFSLQQYFCDSYLAGYPLLAGRGVESLSITRSHGWSAPDVNQACQLLWRLPVSSVHPLPADMIWWEMILNNSRLGSDVSRGLERQKILTDNTL